MCDPILVTLLKMQPYYGHSSRENATPSKGTSPLACYKEVSSIGNAAICLTSLFHTDSSHNVALLFTHYAKLVRFAHSYCSIRSQVSLHCSNSQYEKVR